jgi:predicted nucleotidyltransferase
LEPHNARSIAVFGSVAPGEATVDSEIDFVVEFEPGSAAWAFPLPCSPSLAQGYS